MKQLIPPKNQTIPTSFLAQIAQVIPSEYWALTSQNAQLLTLRSHTGLDGSLSIEEGALCIRVRGNALAEATLWEETLAELCQTLLIRAHIEPTSAP